MVDDAAALTEAFSHSQLSQHAIVDIVVGVLLSRKTISGDFCCISYSRTLAPKINLWADVMSLTKMKKIDQTPRKQEKHRGGQFRHRVNSRSKVKQPLETFSSPRRCQEGIQNRGGGRGGGGGGGGRSIHT